MAIQCPKDIFAEFEEGCGSEVYPDAEALAFLQEWFGEADFVGGTVELQSCIEIECDGKQLLVVFNDFDGWCLGLAGSAWVVKDLKELPEW
jgi:hypothetical protein